MYTVQLNIGSLASPSISGGWIDVECIYVNSTLSKAKEDDWRTRKNIDGDFIFYSDQYTALKTLKDANNLQVGCKLIYDSVEQVEGQLSLLGKWDRRYSICELGFVQDDLYNKIKANLTKEVSLNTSFTIIEHDFTSQTRERGQAVEFAGSPSFTSWDYYSNCGQTSPSAWATATDYTAALQSSSSPNRMYSTNAGDFDNCYVQKGGSWYACIQDHTSSASTEPGVGGSWATYWIRVEEPYSFKQEYADFEFTGSTWVEASDEWQKANCSTGSYTQTMYGKKVFDLLEDILQDIDATIEIYETTSGADTGFCPYIETNYPNLLYLFHRSYEDEPKISLQSILDFYKVTFNCEWNLEGNIFVFRHETEKPSSLGVGSPYDLTNYESTDWSNKVTQNSVIDEVKRETWEFSESNYTDFNTIEIEYDNSYEGVNEHSHNFRTDIKHALIDEDGDYIIAATYSSGWNLYNQVGIISGETVYNGGLSTSRCVYEHHQEGRPFATYEDWTAESDQVLSLTKKRNEEVRLQVPFREIISQNIDNYLFKTSIGNIEVMEISVPLDGSFAEIKGYLT